MYFPDAAIDLSCYGIFLLLSLFLLHLQCSKWHQIAGWLCLSFVLLDNNVVYEFSSLPVSSRYIIKVITAVISVSLFILLLYILIPSLKSIWYYQNLKAEMENKTQKMNEAIEAANRANKNQEEFMAFLCHEIRNPLHAITANVDFLAASLLNPDQKECTDSINDSAKLMCRIVNDVLDLSKLHLGNIVFELLPVNIVHLCYRVINDMRAAAARKNLSLSVKCDKQLPEYIITDSARLQQVLLNLVSNAIKFTPKGSVTVRVYIAPAGQSYQNEDSEQCHLEPLITTKEEEPSARFDLKIDVVDTGFGILPEDMDRLFIPYSQAKLNIYREHGGTGLGLSICQQIITKLGGHIMVNSKVGYGTTVSIILNVAIAINPELQQNSDLRIASVEMNTRRLSYRKILVVDDNEINRKVLAKMISSLGYAVETANDGLQALEVIHKAQEDKQQFIAVFMDISMPHLDGYEATKHIRALNYTMPIIALTANAASEDKEKALRCGMNDFATKPLRKDGVQELLLKTLQSDIFRSSSDPA